MRNTVRTISYVVMAALFIATPSLLPGSAAFALTKAETAENDLALRQTQMALEKSKNDPAFTEAVNAKSAEKVKMILLKNGASKFLSDVVFEGEVQAARKPKITITIKCCPKVIILIQF